MLEGELQDQEMKRVFRWPELSGAQISQLASICADLGTLFVASVVLPTVFGTFKLPLISTGVGLSIMFWLVSLWLVRLK